MEFTAFHKQYFNAVDGAFSRVTYRENFDSQVTFTGKEADIVIGYFGRRNINPGKVSANKELSAKNFLLYPHFQPVTLNVNFPKRTGNELRIYLSIKAGFKPPAGDILFIYKDVFNNLVIGSMGESVWLNIGQDDSLDEPYLNEIEETLSEHPPARIAPEGCIREIIRPSGIIYGRDPRIAIMRLEEVEYKCEIDPSHYTFVAQRTNRPYMEAHHFIPMKYQSLFKNPLDNFENVISLCPNCHRAIHHAIPAYKYKLVGNLYEKRPSLHNYEFEDIAQYYNCLKLPEA